MRGRDALASTSARRSADRRAVTRYAVLPPRASASRVLALRAMTTPFSTLELRTTDLEGARAFYTALLDLRGERVGEELRLFRGDAPVAPVTVLPEQARLRGAPANWCGHVVVQDLNAVVNALCARGAERLGPTRTLGTGSTVVLLRGVGGEPFAVASPSTFPGPDALPPAAWHELHTTTLEDSLAFYTEVFAWARTTTTDLGPALGPYVDLARTAGSPAFGAAVGSAGKNGISPHWEFYFAVADLDEALERVRALGGDVHHGPHATPSGARFAGCHDPQGAAFGLAERVSAG